ncbi:MAG TPA: pseudouridine synthase [Candidatus Saccharibacteria bacterium]|jgi:23S rRNA pseudouridine2605 synthase|nr:pseudouridine synthase [Candidatus Saccharibacteria bacterium]HMT56078.1 pseudouridine synthase [Candidatus Saccharibacteria bacterium]
MRLNRYIASHSTLSRRKADELIAAGKVKVNRTTAHLGTEVQEGDTVIVDGQRLEPTKKASIVVLLHKPAGYVCSKDGQGAPTVYDLISPNLHYLNIAGRLDKDSSGLVIFTNDGTLLQALTHPSNDKEKIYHVVLAKQLEDGAIASFASGVNIGDERTSKMSVVPLNNKNTYEVSIHEGRNRQIRRSFEALGYKVEQLHRIKLGQYEIGRLAPKQYQIV